MVAVDGDIMKDSDVVEIVFSNTGIVVICYRFWIYYILFILTILRFT